MRIIYTQVPQIPKHAILDFDSASFYDDKNQVFLKVAHPNGSCIPLEYTFTFATEFEYKSCKKSLLTLGYYDAIGAEASVHVAEYY